MDRFCDRKPTTTRLMLTLALWFSMIFNPGYDMYRDPLKWRDSDGIVIPTQPGKK